MIKAVVFDCFGVVLDVMRNFKNEDVIALIKELKPDYRTAMLSNVSGRRSLDERFGPGELDELFDEVVASGDIGFEKPDPEIYEMTAAKLGLTPEECLFVDDIPQFAEAARKVGMTAVHFDGIASGIAAIKQALNEKA